MAPDVSPTAHSTAALHDHFVICGLGRVGQEVLGGLRRRNRTVAAVDLNPAALSHVPASHSVLGDATNDSVLKSAGVERARGLAAATGSDASNLAIVLTARALNADIRIVARANLPDSEAKLLRAGASRVVSPYAIGARRMATQLVSPGIVAFLDAIRDAEQVDLWIEEATVVPGSVLVDNLVRDVIPRLPGLPNLIAVRRDGRFLTGPFSDLRLAQGDTLIIVGSRTEAANLVGRATRGPATSKSDLV